MAGSLKYDKLSDPSSARGQTALSRSHDESQEQLEAVLEAAREVVGAWSGNGNINLAMARLSAALTRIDNFKTGRRLPYL